MEKLTPDLRLLSEEYVLVQAWKKTSAYIRYHNWFADTLALDQATADLPSFLASIATEIRGGEWRADPLRLVPAPKSQDWKVDGETGEWSPAKPLKPSVLRPLAHVSLRDQVVATAIMLCLSERVETRQGDPRQSYSHEDARSATVSYGNRLFCDWDSTSKSLVHRWGSARLYRAYFDDYKNFLSRPEYVAEKAATSTSTVFIVQTDLSQFYDRVRPALLGEKLRRLQETGDDERFLNFATSALKWRWHEDDLREATDYASKIGIEGFGLVGLPQGLVAAGFFSNVTLLDFDNALREGFGKEIEPGIRLLDACRYVDDFRLTLDASAGLSAEDVRQRIVSWLGGLLSMHAKGLSVSEEKTKVAALKGDDQPLIRQSRKMQRIQAAISGGFDAAGGEDVIHAVQGLVRSQEELASIPSPGVKALTAVPDVRDETIGRFAAIRFRKTFRSLRPLLQDRSLADFAASPKTEVGEETLRRARLTQRELDEEAQSFAISLINTWTKNPSSVRLLRVALDLWPTPQVITAVTRLLRRHVFGAKNITARRVAFYCLSEVLRAGATETGIVPDSETLPADVDLTGYRAVLTEVSLDVLKSKARSLPWYLRQQAILYLLVHGRDRISNISRSNDHHLTTYIEMLEFLQGASGAPSDEEFAIRAVVARRSFLARDKAIELVSTNLSPSRFTAIASRDLEFARDLYPVMRQPLSQDSALADDLAATDWSTAPGMEFLSKIVSAGGEQNPLRNDIGILSFAAEFLKQVTASPLPPVITPTNLQLRYELRGNYAFVQAMSFQSLRRGPSYRSIYTPPSWVSADQVWKFQLGFLVRYILSARVDFSTAVHPESWRSYEPVYRPTRSHWLQRIYGFFNGHEAFGDNWLPISQFTEDLLYSLLLWPGCRVDESTIDSSDPSNLLGRVRAELQLAEQSVGAATGMLMLKIAAPPPVRQGDRPLRACVVQSITPEPNEIKLDLTLSASAMRRRHRNHLSTALAAVEKMLDLRDTHKNQNKRLDWLILPELSVHPDDVRSHLIRFARAFKTIILAEITFQELFPNRPLVNAALWVIPRMIAGQGLQVVTRLQGKKHLAPIEQALNATGQRIMGFRPCQWLVGYEWTDGTADPLWLTAAICYDATDLNLAADLRDRSDVFAIPALNQDVGTFDHMAQALHYHMYQLVLIANNGGFGGSNAYLPKGESYNRQVFHTHGQPQATISFLEIDDIDQMKKRHKLGRLGPKANMTWKFPPAGS